MQQTQTKPRLDRDARREAILDVAQDVFLEEGFGAASMSTIAARLGGSKGTLYNYFRSKDELFTAYVMSRCLWQQEEVFESHEDSESAPELLQRFGRAYLTNVLAEKRLRSFRLIMSEAERSPEIGRVFYEAGPQNGAERLAVLLAEMQAAGHLDLDDPLDAAHQFLGLVQNRFLKARLCNAIPDLAPQQIDEEAARAVSTFLRAFGTDRRP